MEVLKDPIVCYLRNILLMIQTFCARKRAQVALPNTSLDAEGNRPYQARSPRKETYVIKKHSAFSPSFLSSDKRNKKEIFLSLTSIATKHKKTRPPTERPTRYKDSSYPLPIQPRSRLLQPQIILRRPWIARTPYPQSIEKQGESENSRRGVEILCEFGKAKAAEGAEERVRATSWWQRGSATETRERFNDAVKECGNATFRRKNRQGAVRIINY